MVLTALVLGCISFDKINFAMELLSVDVPIIQNLYNITLVETHYQKQIVYS